MDGAGSGDGGSEPFWRRVPLQEMSRAEWESLCDGCGKCCLVKLEDVDTGVIEFTDVACRLLDHKTCRCRKYETRKRYVPECVILTPETISELRFMPSTCAYRLLSEGADLPAWHPLVSGDPESVHKARQSVRRRIVSEQKVPEWDLENHIVDWPR
ncbi:YcgN family cysteine cluster protein [Zavarzinia sp. CC-PAN008]|uniref:YcgN family cysteine cluster protein n=1 Tax=Zavarzinia sp. CC-PAN008 TaxID=3243332 RepID=UPI003F7491F1